jgi:hypothetical protein
MTGYQSKRTAALDEDGMYLVHHTARMRTWVDLTKEEKQECVNRSMYHTAWSSDIDVGTLIEVVSVMLKEKNS